MTILIIVLGMILVITAVAALYVKQLVSAIIIAGVVSLIGSILFLLVGAPDVAMTEAAIGSALTTVIFLFAWSRIRDTRRSHDTTAESGTKEEQHD
ncbi:MAG: hypothetical protein CVV52_14375 [Spirochaetae bacterium HGW-Spirochaetae-8]|jgi:uncharacterized MnhB-related membrane protein|nr:MAG: hypothetical protein CVV52_14375 [Spirochaetae bacterium HGW-Spirochaetae-8]